MNSPSLNAPTAEDQARADVYQLLGILLAAPPGEELLARLRDIEVPAGSEGAAMPEAWRGLRLAACAAEPDAVEREFNLLFIGLGRGELSPYLSSYLTGYLMERPLAELRTELGKLGYERQDHVREPEDHIAAVCEVMGMTLAENELSFKNSKSFFERFLDPWAGDFFQDLSHAETANFYRAVGTLGAAFIEVEKRFFSMPS